MGVLEQLALAYFIESGAYERQVRRVRTTLKRATESFMEGIEVNNKGVSSSSEKFVLRGVGTGSHFLLSCSRGPLSSEVLEEVARKGVSMTPLEAYYLEVTRGGCAHSDFAQASFSCDASSTYVVDLVGCSIENASVCARLLCAQACGRE
jgi:DNA-binding transcriptional MocR family regulator